MGFGGSGGHAEELGGSAGTGDGGHQEAADGGTTSRGGAGGSGVGGTTATGGSGVGGTTATGGSGVGGATETGGSGVGGTTATGGSGVGGTTATGGSGVGGATATGGSGVGGTTATGGSGVGGATVVDPCDGAPCQNGGTCIPAGTTYTCECTNGYAGATCTRLIFRMVGSVKNSSGDCAAKAVSGNGKVVVGSCKSSTTTGAPSEAYRWANGTTTLLPATTGSAEATGVDDNGIVIVGWTNTATVTRLATWTGTTITTSPYGMGTGTSGTWGEAISGDGRYLLGEILKPLDPTDDYLTQMYITRWDTVAYPIEPITIYTPTVYMSARATDISTDGSVAIGRDDETYHGFLWVEGSAGTALPLIEGALYSDANGISGNGHVVVGSVGTLAVRWIDGGTPVSLGFAGTGMATNENGSIIVGEAGGAPFIWTESEGIEFLATEFEDRGVNLSGWSLQQATDISNDGTIVIGEGTYNGVKRAWIADLSETGIAGQ